MARSLPCRFEPLAVSLVDAHPPPAPSEVIDLTLRLSTLAHLRDGSRVAKMVAHAR